MKVSYTNLQQYFDSQLPSPEALADALTFHAWEIEGVTKVGNDTVLDVKVLPDKSAWALSHRGIAKDISVILNIPLAHDPLSEPALLHPLSPELSVQVTTDTCTRYTAALIRGVKVGPSPAWLSEFMQSMGQRSINNVVDLTNYVMLGIGQPLHAFDAGKLSYSNVFSIGVRNANDGESITTLTGETYELSNQDALIVDGGSNAPIGIAGVKGGKVAEVDAETVDILLESANFDAIKVRKTSQRLRLRTDASARYENGISCGMASYGVVYGAQLITKCCGGTIVGYVDTNPEPVARAPVALTRTKVNSVLGLSLSMAEIAAIVERFGYVYVSEGDTITVTPPFERPDIVIPEDLIEEIGRINGYEHVPTLRIAPIPLREINKRFYYSEAVRDVLLTQGFSEVFTSSFRDIDEVKLKNALASDKEYLRSEQGIVLNMREALAKNAPVADLFGSEQVRLFEIGKVFDRDGEHDVLVLGVSSKQGFVAKKDQKILDAGLSAAKSVLGDTPVVSDTVGTLAINLSNALEVLERPVSYTSHPHASEVTYKPFSSFPYMTRDIAFWGSAETTEEDALAVVKNSAGPLALRIDMFDRFTKEGKVSYGFRIVFQSHEKTLDSVEADAYMQTVYDAIRTRGWEVR